MTHRVDGKTFVAKVREVAAANPDRVYMKPADAESCVYVHAGAPSCILGHAMWQLGLIDSTLESTFRNQYNIETIAETASDLILSSGEVDWLNQVQVEQDAGCPWSEAVQTADAAAAAS